MAFRAKIRHFHPHFTGISEKYKKILKIFLTEAYVLVKFAFVYQNNNTNYSHKSCSLRFDVCSSMNCQT